MIIHLTFEIFHKEITLIHLELFTGGKKNAKGNSNKR